MAIHSFRLPDLGEKIKEAKVTKWLVKEGDIVEEYDDLADVTTDKLATKIPSTYSGKIHKLLVEEDGFCEVGQILLEIDDLGEGIVSEIETPKTEKAEKKEEVIAEGKPLENFQQEGKTKIPLSSAKNFSNPVLSNKLEKLIKSKMVSGEREKALCTPAVRALAKSLEIDINLVPGDSSGRIKKEDVLNYHAKISTHIKDEIVEKRETVSKQREAPVSKSKPVSDGGFQTVKMSMYEQGMVKSMTESLSVPDFLLHEQFDVTQLTILRQQLNEISDVKISLFSLLIKTFSLALEKNEKLNSLYFADKDPYSYQIHSDHNISIAIDSKNGLVAPNIKAVQNLSMRDVQGEISRLKNLANSEKLGFNELGGGTICLSNIGTMGGTYTGPIALPNQVCIVGIGKVTSELKFNGSSADKMKILKKEIAWTAENFDLREVIYVSFAGDHRVIDGATMARFANEWKKIIENPMELITRLR